MVTVGALQPRLFHEQVHAAQPRVSAALPATTLHEEVNPAGQSLTHAGGTKPLYDCAMQDVCDAPLAATHVECPAQNSPPSPSNAHSRDAPASHELTALLTIEVQLPGCASKWISIEPPFVGENPAPGRLLHADEMLSLVAEAVQPEPVVKTACRFVHDGGVPGVHEQAHCAGPPSVRSNVSAVLYFAPQIPPISVGLSKPTSDQPTGIGGTHACGPAQAPAFVSQSVSDEQFVVPTVASLPLS